MTRTQAQETVKALMVSLFDLQQELLNRNMTEQEAARINRCFYRAALLEAFLNQPKTDG